MRALRGKHGAPAVNTSALAVRAAIDGLDIAYAIEAQTERFLRSGQLIRVLEGWSPPYEGYFPKDLIFMTLTPSCAERTRNNDVRRPGGCVVPTCCTLC
jgi:hypothetical protein